MSHESYEEVSQQDDPGGHEAAAWQEATLGALGEAAAGEGAAQAPPVIRRVVPGGHDAALPLAPLARAPPVISFVPGAQEVASQEATLQEVAAREGAAEAVITVVPGGHDAASGEARARKAARARETEGPVRAPPVITVVPGVREATLPEAASRAAFQEAAAQAAAAVDQFINVLLNVDHDTHKLMIIKLVSNIDLRRSIEEVLSTVPIISQATFNKSTVNWEECTPPYAVDMRSFRNHTRGEKKGLPRDSDPNIRTVGERIALSRAKKKVLKAFVGIGTLEQQQLILLRVLSDSSFQNISSSIGINMMKETKLGQQLL